MFRAFSAPACEGSYRSYSRDRSIDGSWTNCLIWSRSTAEGALPYLRSTSPPPPARCNTRSRVVETSVGFGKATKIKCADQSIFNLPFWHVPSCGSRWLTISTGNSRYDGPGLVPSCDIEVGHHDIKICFRRIHLLCVISFFHSSQQH